MINLTARCKVSCARVKCSIAIMWSRWCWNDDRVAETETNTSATYAVQYTAAARSWTKVRREAVPVHCREIRVRQIAQTYWNTGL